MIQDSPLSNKALADQLGVTIRTIRRWRNRPDVEDRSHVPHRLQTTLSPAQEAGAVALRWMLLLPLDDLLTVVREFLCPAVSRSGLDRCLRRHQLPPIRTLKSTVYPAHSRPAERPGYLRIMDVALPHVREAPGTHRLQLAIDRHTAWACARCCRTSEPHDIVGFIQRCADSAPFSVRTLQTAHENQAVTKWCRERHIEHVIHPSAYILGDMSTTCVDAISDVFQSRHFVDSDSLDQLVERFTQIYNNRLILSCIGNRTPLDAVAHLL